MSGTVPPSGKATVDALADNWGKLFAAYMMKQGTKEVVLTVKDFESFGTDGEISHCIVVQELEDGLHIKLTSPEEATRLAKESKHRGFGKS